jgi:hypothetical protein
MVVIGGKPGQGTRIRLLRVQHCELNMQFEERERWKSVAYVKGMHTLTRRERANTAAWPSTYTTGSRPQTTRNARPAPTDA